MQVAMHITKPLEMRAVHRTYACLHTVLISSIHILCFCVKAVKIDLHHQVVQLGLSTDLHCSGSQNFEQVAMAIPEASMKLLKLLSNLCLWYLGALKTTRVTMNAITSCWRRGILAAEHSKCGFHAVTYVLMQPCWSPSSSQTFSF